MCSGCGLDNRLVHRPAAVLCACVYVVCEKVFLHAGACVKDSALSPAHASPRSYARPVQTSTCDSVKDSADASAFVGVAMHLHRMQRVHNDKAVGHLAPVHDVSMWQQTPAHVKHCMPTYMGSISSKRLWNRRGVLMRELEKYTKDPHPSAGSRCWLVIVNKANL